MNTAAYIHGPRDIRVEPFHLPPGNDHSVAVSIESVGVCGSDLHYYKDGGIGAAVIREPFVPGHEFSARLEQDVDSLGLTRGQLVAVDPATPCHHCEWCQRGYHNLCPHVVFLGAPPYHGALTQSLHVPSDSIIALPAGMTADQGAMLEPLGVCVHAIDLAKPKLLETVAVIGCGPIGLGILQLLALSGCSEIIAIDPQPHRSTLAKELGATQAAVHVDAVMDFTRSRGCDLVIEATNSPAGLVHAVAAARIGGRVVMVGIPDGDNYAPLPAAEARRRGLSISFSRRMGNVYPRAIELVSNQKVDVDVLVSHRFVLEDTAQAFALQADETVGLIKSMVYPNRTELVL